MTANPDEHSIRGLDLGEAEIAAHGLSVDLACSNKPGTVGMGCARVPCPQGPWKMMTVSRILSVAFSRLLSAGV